MKLGKAPIQNMFLPFNRGIKHDLLIFARSKDISVEKVREVFNASRRTLPMVINDKIMFDGYYCLQLQK